MSEYSRDKSAESNVLYLGDFRRPSHEAQPAPLPPRNRTNAERETPTETAIRFGLFAVVAMIVLFAAYQV